MNIGDKVRVIKGIEEGVVTRIINDKLIEIEIEAGFTMPVLKSEVVIVASEEKNYFKREETVDSISEAAPKSLFNQSAYLAFEFEEGKTKAECYFINNTTQLLLIAASEIYKGNVHTYKVTDKCAPHSFLKVGNYDLSQFEQWPEFAFSIIKTDARNRNEPEFIKKHFSPKAKNFFKSKTKSPLRNQPAYVFDVFDNPVKIDVKELKENLFKGEEAPTENPFSNEAIELDLHIESLREDFEFLKPNEILPLQLKAFEDALDEAIAKNRPEITFIHGIGSGKLKHEVSKVLSKHPNVKFYEDANKTKFGYGATKATLK